MTNKVENVRIPVVRARVLGVNLYRGYASLGLLAEISQPDIYNQENNPFGTQRDLNSQHAKDAYDYVKERKFGFWPEIFLCARDSSVLTYTPLSDEMLDVGFIEIDKSKIDKSKDEISISRIDGNHRLFYADGQQKGFSRIENKVSFCISYDLTIDEEILLFKDINKNQKPMSTSHLDTIVVRLTPDEELKKTNPSLFIANQLSSQNKSPFNKLISMSGKKTPNAYIPLRSLNTGIEYLLSRSSQLPRLGNIDAQYKLIENYFNAVKLWQPNAWEKYKDYLMMRGVGLWAICILGAEIIDISLKNNKFSIEEMLRILNSGKECDWSNSGEFKGLSGRGGANQICDVITRSLRSSNGPSIEDLIDEILK